MRRAGFLLMAIATWLLTTGAAGAQTAPLCDGLTATIWGTAGDDFLLGTNGPDVIAGLQGNDTIFGLDGDDVICGGIGDDGIIGGQGFDVIFGAQGDDLIYAAGHDSFFLPDSLTDTAGSRIFAGAGNDTVYGSDRWDRMQGGPGNDFLLGFAGNDWLRGGPGIDVVAGHAGSDDLHGGGGDDLMQASRNDAAVRGGAGQDRCPKYPGRTYPGCKEFFLARWADGTLPVDTVPDAIAGGTANQYVYVVESFGAQIFVGVTADLETVNQEAGTFEQVIRVNDLPLTNGQARSVQAEIISQNPSIESDNPISPNAAHHEAARQWGVKWININGLVFTPI